MFGKLQQKLASGLKKTRDAIRTRLGKLSFAGRRIDEELLDELEETLILADLGPELVALVRERLAAVAKGTTVESTEQLMELVERELLGLLPAAAPEQLPAAPPRVTLVVGVNGSGKTTTVGKLAARWQGDGRKVLVAAADTFRAAAVEQLVVWAERAGASVVRAQTGADPAAVGFDAARAARSRACDDLLVDTAGRLHNKKPLMDELSKISRVIAKEIPGAPHETLLVLDGTTGRNAVVQAREFARVAPVTGLVLTKLDGTAKGGVAVTIGRELGIPVRYVGVGEGVQDLLPFDAEAYVRGLLLPGGGAGDAE